MKKVLPWLSILPVAALLWPVVKNEFYPKARTIFRQMYTYTNNQRREDRKERRAWEKTVDARFDRLDSCFKALNDTVYADKRYGRLVDEALATVESRVNYMIWKARRDSTGK